MASPNIYPNGLNLAGTVFENGPSTLQAAGPTYLSGLVQWVDTISGNNTNSGNLPELPVATLAQAITNSTTNGVIVIGEGSAETLSGAQAVAIAGLSIFGCGTGSSRPRYTCSGAVNMLNVTAAGVWIEGLYFPAPTAAPTDRIGASGASVTVKDCYFECGANADGNGALALSGNAPRVEGCSFVVTASRPNAGIVVTGAITDMTIVDCTFDGGSFGWADYALKVTTASTRVRIINPTLINRSDLGFTVTATSYGIFGVTMPGTGNVLLTA